VTDQQEWLTVAEAAQQIGVSAPRLRRLLQSRPDLSCQIQYVERETRTGRRMAQTVPRTVLPALQEALPERVEQFHIEDAEPLQERISGTVPVLSEVEFLRGEVEFGREQMREKDRQIAALHDLLRAEKEEKAGLMQERSVPALPAPENVEQNGNANGSGTESRTERNGFWRKLLQRK
jgi:hypothetical protein